MELQLLILKFSIDRISLLASINSGVEALNKIPKEKEAELITL